MRGLSALFLVIIHLSTFGFDLAHHLQHEQHFDKCVQDIEHYCDDFADHKDCELCLLNNQSYSGTITFVVDEVDSIPQKKLLTGQTHVISSKLKAKAVRGPPIF